MNDTVTDEGAPLADLESADGAGFSMPEAGAETGLATMTAQPPRMDTIMRIPVTVRVVLGSATMPVANLMKLGRGSVIPLERRVGEPVEVAVNGHTVAKGQVVVMDEATSRFGIKLTEVLTQSPISDVAS
jgi:flagellar motor switch protein FliN